MGALYSGRCYEAASDAAAVMWSGVSPVLSAGSPPAVSTVEHSGGEWWIVTREAGAVVASVEAPAVQFAACDPGASVADGIELAFLVVLVWAAAWGVRVLGPVAAGRGAS